VHLLVSEQNGFQNELCNDKNSQNKIRIISYLDMKYFKLTRRNEDKTCFVLFLALTLHLEVIF
jgi:hypothetical protein